MSFRACLRVAASAKAGLTRNLIEYLKVRSRLKGRDDRKTFEMILKIKNNHGNSKERT